MMRGNHHKWDHDMMKEMIINWMVGIETRLDALRCNRYRIGPLAPHESPFKSATRACHQSYHSQCFFCYIDNEDVHGKLADCDKQCCY